MTSKSNLPAEVHDHFRKANVLHTYVQKDLGEATKHALETGQELLAAKSTVPHRKWEDECNRLFDGSLRTAQFYMQFAKDMGSIKSAAKSAVLMLEGTLDGAAKAARKAAHPEAVAPKQKPVPSTPIRGDRDPFDDIDQFEEEEGQDGRTDSDGTESKETPSRPPRKALQGAEKEAHTACQQIKIWSETIGRWLRQSPSIDDYRGKWPGPKGDRVVKATTELYEALKLWQKGIKRSK